MKKYMLVVVSNDGEEKSFAWSEKKMVDAAYDFFFKTLIQGGIRSVTMAEVVKRDSRED